LMELRESLTRVTLELFEDVGNAIESIGRKSKETVIVTEGQDIQIVARYLSNLGGRQSASMATPLEALKRKSESELVVTWLRQHQDVVPNIIKQSESEWNHNAIVQFMRIAQVEN
jgi:Lon protease-like protein